MNREDIIRLAHEAGLLPNPEVYVEDLDRFAELISTAERERIKAANAPVIEGINRHLSEMTAAISEIRAVLTQQEEPETCTWQQDGYSGSETYSTSCRRYFCIVDGTPEDNKMQWCCYCGKKLVQELITEEDDE